MKLCMVGAGYVGLVSGAGFAEMGHSVICADIDQTKIDQLEKGEVPIFEPGLAELLERNIEGGRLSFTTDVSAAVAASEVVFVGVGTPPRSDGAADLSAVDRVVEVVAKAATSELILVLKSTVPVGTNARARRIVSELAEHEIHVASNPEFLKEGDAVNDFLHPDRIVIGCDEDNPHVRTLLGNLYHPLCLDRNRIIWMDPVSAELTKYVGNTMLAMRISFMNEIAGLCEKVGADVHNVRRGVGSDTRIGSKFLYPGPGYGGSCFPKDVQALVQTAREYGIELELAGATDRVNHRQKGVLARKLRRHFDGDLRGKRIAIWGLAFKPKTDDVRESASLILIDVLLSEGAEVIVHDPAAMEHARLQLSDRVEFAQNAYEAAVGADALVLCTEWRQYQNPDFDRLMSTLRNPLLIDGRNIWSTYGLAKRGFTYEGIGVKGLEA